MMQTGRAHGMITFESAINELIRKGAITGEVGHNFLARRSPGGGAAAKFGKGQMPPPTTTFRPKPAALTPQALS
jgi:hypothetical protein